VQTLLDNPPQLARILKYHVLVGAQSRQALLEQPEWPSLEGAPLQVGLAARSMLDLDGTAALLTAAGLNVVDRSVGRPRLDAPADLIVWDVGQIDADTLTWLGMLTAHMPERTVVLLESFPRGDTTLAAVRAGAAAVLSRPVSLESVAGTLARLKQAHGTGLGTIARDL
jgi:CheY-like chemotaxis protein